MKSMQILSLSGFIYILTVVGAGAAVVTQYSFEDNLLDSAPAGVNADDLTAILIGGAGAESYEAGIVGQAVRLDIGTGNAFVLSAPDSDDLDLASDWTLEAFVKPDFQNTGEWDRFWTKWGEGSNDWHWAFRYGNNGEDYFMNGAQVFDGASDLPANSVPLDQWSHVAVVGNSAAGTVSGYLDGTQVVSAAYVAPVTGVSAMNFGNFAHGGNTNGLQYTGLIDEALIHNMAVDDTYLAGRAALLPGIEPPDTTVEPPPTTGLVSYYTFDDHLQDVDGDCGYSQNTGVVDDDLTPRDGTANFVAGQIGNALRVGVEAGDLTDLRTDVSADVNLPATYTIEAWIKPSELTDGWQRLVLNWGAERAYHFAIRNNGGFVNGVSLFHEQSDGAQPNANGGTVVVDEWQHIAGVADGSHLNVYLDGELAAQVPYDGTINTSASEGLGIGDSDTALSTIKYNGLLDDLAMWSVPLTPEQIRFQYQQGLLGKGATCPEPDGLVLALVGGLALLGHVRRLEHTK
jgi:hypothetical protein